MTTTGSPNLVEYIPSANGTANMVVGRTLSLMATTAGQPITTRSDSNPLPPIVLSFVKGVEGAHPSPHAINVAAKVVRAAQQAVIDPEIVHDDDGELSFFFRLADGRLLMAELSLEGTLWASIHSEELGRKPEVMMPADIADLLELFD